MNLARTKTGAYSHIKIERCPRPRYRKSTPVEALVCGAVLLAAGIGVWVWRVWR